MAGVFNTNKELTDKSADSYGDLLFACRRLVLDATQTLEPNTADVMRRSLALFDMSIYPDADKIKSELNESPNTGPSNS